MAAQETTVERWRTKLGLRIAGRRPTPYRVLYNDAMMHTEYSPHFRDYSSYLRAVKEVPWVYACLKAIAYNVANAEFALYKRVPGGEPEIIEKDPFLTLWNTPNPFRTGFAFRERIIFDLELTGNFFCSLEEWSWLGLPTSMYRLQPDIVTIHPDPYQLVAGYSYGQGRARIAYTSGEVLHISYPNPEDELYGMGVIEAAEYRMNSARAMARHEANFWENGAKITGVLTSPEKLPETTFKRLTTNFAKFIRGSGFSTLILEGGVDYKSVSDSPAKLGLRELSQMSREEILGLFGVPPTKVGIIDSANYKALAADEAFWNEKIDPTLTRIEVALQPLVDLFHPSTAPGTYFLRYEEIDYGTDKDMLENVSTMSRNKTRSLNEMRDYEGLDPVPNGDVIIFEAQNFYLDTKKGEFHAIVAPPAQNPKVEGHAEAGGAPIKAHAVQPLSLAPGADISGPTQEAAAARAWTPVAMELDHVGGDGTVYYRVATKFNTAHGEHGHFASTGGGGHGVAHGAAPPDDFEGVLAHPVGKALYERGKGNPAGGLDLNDVRQDHELKAVMEHLGYNATPKVVSKAELDSAIAGGATQWFRGLSTGDAPKYAEQYRTGDHFVGRGIHGNGTYTASDLPTARQYGNAGIPASVMRGALKPGAKTIDTMELSMRMTDDEPKYQAAKAKIKAHVESMDAPFEEKVKEYTARQLVADTMYRNPAAYAALHGYDAISATHGSDMYYVLLNRGAQLVQKEPAG